MNECCWRLQIYVWCLNAVIWKYGLHIKLGIRNIKMPF